MIDMRSYRGPNSHNRQAVRRRASRFLGPQQAAWLHAELKKSEATWKVIASDMPIGLKVGDGKDAEGRARWEAWPTVTARRSAASSRSRNCCRSSSASASATRCGSPPTCTTPLRIYYHPNRAQFQDFDPFWEFVSGPLNAGSFGPNDLDNTFGPEGEVREGAARRASEPASDGRIAVLRRSADRWQDAALTVHLRDLEGRSLWSTTLAPRGAV